MGIDSNTFAPQDSAARADNQERHTNWSDSELGKGATASSAAPSGKLDFLSMTSRIGLSRIDSAVEPYLEKSLKLIKDNMPNVSLVRLDRMQNSYAFMFEGPDATLNFFGIQFLSVSDPVSAQFVPASQRLKPMQDELRQRYENQKIRIVDGRVILAGYEGDMSLFYNMADTVVRTFQMSAIAELKNADIGVLQATEFVADWRLSEAKIAEQSLSPHGVRPRMEIGLTLKAKIKNEYGSREFREYDTDYRTLGVIGGYTEIRDKEEFIIDQRRHMLYRPVFNITVCNAMIPLEGVAAVLIAALAPTIYGTKFWLKQWAELGDNKPNPGMLEASPEARDRPIILQDQEELLDFTNTFFAPPVIAFQFQDGRDSIPGMWRLAASEQSAKAHFQGRLSNFFGTPEDNSANAELSRVIEIRSDGAYGDPTGVLHDSREVDYLYTAAKMGFGAIDPQMRRLLLNGSDNASDRARLVQNVTGSFIPMFLTTQAIVNPDWIKWIIQRTEARRLMIVDPNSTNDVRSLGSFTDGFGSSTNMGSIVSNGQVNRGLNLSSVWASSAF